MAGKAPNFIRIQLMAGCALCALSASAFAQELDNPVDLGVLVVRGDILGDISDEEVFRFPGNRQVVDVDAESKERGDASVSDVIKRVPGAISSQNSGTGGSDLALNVGVRGLTQRLSPRATVLLDGIPVANAPYTQPQLSFSPITLGSIGGLDVLRGGGQVRYGPQNVGGIFNFRSRDVPDAFTLETTFDLRFFGNGPTDATFNTGDIFVGGRLAADDRFGYALSYSTVQGETYRANSDRDIHNLYAKLQFDLNENHRFTLLGQVYDGEASLPGGLSQAQYEADRYQSTRPFDKGRVEREMVAFQYEGQLSPSTKLEFQTYYYENFREFQFSRQNSAPYDQASSSRFDVLPRTYEVFGIDTRIAHAFTLGSADIEVGAGVRYLTEDSIEQRFRRSGGSYDPFDPFASTATLNRSTTIDTEALSYFVDATIDIGDFRIVPGVRFEDVDSLFVDQLSGDVRDVEYNEVLPSLGLNYALSDTVSLFASYNESFGAVQQVQLSSASRFNPNIEPELATIYEVGARFNNGVVSASATGFLVDFDSVFFIDSSGDWTNSGATRHRGLELEGSWRIPNSAFSLYGNYTYTKATDEGFTATNGNRLEFTSEHVGLVGVNYDGGNYSLFAELYGQSDQFSDRENTVAESADGRLGRIHGFGLVNAGGTWDVNDNFTVKGGVRNLLNKDHFTRSTDSLGRGKYAGEPRTLYMQGTIKF